jgi:hypothetical protein
MEIRPTQADYDLFLCYAADDEASAASELVRQLREWRISFAQAATDFIPGRPILDELERIATAARLVVYVISPRQTCSVLAQSEIQRLARLRAAGKIRPILLVLDQCTIPRQLADCESIRLDPEHPNQLFLELIRILRTQTSLYIAQPLYVDLHLCQISTERTQVGRAYLSDITLTNPSRSPLVFDTIRVLLNPRHGERRSRELARVEIYKRSAKMEISFVYEDTEQRSLFLGLEQNQADASREPIIIPPSASITIRNIELHKSPLTQLGSQLCEVTTDLTAAGVPVTEASAGVLPPLHSLPDVQEAKRCKLPLYCVSDVPNASGIHSTDVNDHFETAYRRSKQSQLVCVEPAFVATHTFESGDVTHSCSDWRFIFRSIDGRCFETHADDPWWPHASHRSVGLNGDQVALSEDLLCQSNIDCRAAYLLAKAIGAAPDPDSITLSLQSYRIDGRPRPVWRVPFLHAGGQVGILADDVSVQLFPKTGQV